MDISRFRIDLANLKYDESRPLEFSLQIDYVTTTLRYASC